MTEQLKPLVSLESSPLWRKWKRKYGFLKNNFKNIFEGYKQILTFAAPII
jgi:hypothetical protein